MIRAARYLAGYWTERFSHRHVTYALGTSLCTVIESLLAVVCSVNAVSDKYLNLYDSMPIIVIDQ
ncbi:hypothetical protein DPMN_177107 [Dreissena polymorpha]|uniref:Uncharacterized protein n=1 Tax=Dreissena polymorpha TaxID=45954 RepID=A0A9D4IK89_DREPO|nr:hypothetical protein DPMN_177107 [Dreissena polymorpha]